MSAYPDRSKKALMVIDVQNGVVDYAKNRNVIVGRIKDLVDRAREAKVDVIWVQHSEDDMQLDSDLWQIVPELKPSKDERIVHKLWRSSFEETDLEDILEELKIDHLVVTGAQTNYCVRHTIHAAIERGLDVTLISDAHTTLDESWDGELIPAEMIVAELNRGFDGYELPDSEVVVTAAELLKF
jgi:nicotinamidase-related amidase